jgi:transposase
MRDRDLYARILGIEEPWSVVDVKLDQAAKTVEVFLQHVGKGTCPVPGCTAACGGYDSRERRWRHLDTCQFQTILAAKVPRVDCTTHGVRQVRVPWAEEGSQFTAMFESLVIDWLHESNTAAVAREMGLTWDEVHGIMSRAVARGLERRKLDLPAQLGVDETSFQKRHEYVTVVCDGSSGKVLHVADGRSVEALSGFYRQFSKSELAAIDTIAMDMCKPYIQATHACVPAAEEKIAFDRFHVAKHLGEAVDKVRRAENKHLLSEGDERLKGTKFFWLQNPDNMSELSRQGLDALKDTALRTARAWAIKETAANLWGFASWTKAKREWLRWYGWAIRSRLEPVKQVARMVKRHLVGILNAVVSGATNAMSEGGINSAIQRIKYNARGYRNRDNFRAAIYFHLGGLDLYPRLGASPAAHTTS